MPGRGWHTRRRIAPTGYSRNETLFHNVRHYAYREMRHHFGNPASYQVAIERETAIRNADFPTPLSANELDHISQSITNWTIHHSRMWNDGPAVYEATFTAIQAARGRKGGLKGSGRNGGLTSNSRPGGHARGEAQIEASQRIRETVFRRALS